MSSTNTKQSDTSKLEDDEALVAYLLNDNNSFAHCCGQRGTGEYSKKELTLLIKVYVHQQQQKAVREALERVRNRIDDAPSIEVKNGTFIHWNEFDSIIDAELERLNQDKV